MAKRNLINQRFGHLIVLADSGQRASNGTVMWECLCDCGNTCLVSTGTLTHKTHPKTSCGCEQKTNAKNLSNQRFGKLIALEPTEKRINGKVQWRCLCDCGKEHYATSANLLSGAVASCGCVRTDNLIKARETRLNKLKQNLPILPKSELNKLTIIKQSTEQLFLCKCECGNEIELTRRQLYTHLNCGQCAQYSEIGKIYGNWKILQVYFDQQTPEGYYLYQAECQNCGALSINTITYFKKEHKFCEKCRYHNLLGKKFFNLTPIEYMGTNEQHRGQWKCRCDCGKIITVSGSNLISANTKSCGCIQTSTGETVIEQTLQSMSINYEREKTFQNCRFPNTGALAKFDFYLPEYDILIEFDGQQHFLERQGWDKLEQVQYRDRYKNEWCKQNNIPLFRFSYKDLNQLSTKIIELCFKLQNEEKL